MKYILYAKHWQIFLLAFLLPCLLISGGFFYFKIFSNLDVLFYMIPTGIVILQVSVYQWLWSVGTNLSKHVENEKVNASLFKTLIIIPVVILVLVLMFWLILSLKMSISGMYSLGGILISSLIFILPIQCFFSIIAIYCFYFVARIIKQCETQQKMEFENFFKEFVFVILLPIGIWFLQPKINEIISLSHK